MIDPQNPTSIPSEPNFDAYLQWWDQRVRFDLEARRKIDRGWKKSELLIRNSESEFRFGNLAAEFTRTLQLRLFEIDPTVKITADDPDYKSKAENAAVIAASVARVAGLKDNLFEAAISGSWASHGFLEVGHPQDPWNLDVMRSNRSPGLHPTDLVSEQGTGLDQWEEVSPNEVPEGAIASFNPFEEVPQPNQSPEPEPLFNMNFGTPYVASVDPRMVVTPGKAKDLNSCDYVARLRFLSVKELKALVNYQYPGTPSIRQEHRDLFMEVEGEDLTRYPSMLLVVQLYIIRDRNNPEYNGWVFCFPLGEPTKLIYKGPNKDGGMLPLVLVKLNKIKRLYDTTLANELARYADIFDIGIKAIFRDVKRTLNKKWAQAQQSGMDEQEERKLNNDEFSGVVKVGDPQSFRELVEQRMDANLLQSLGWVKGLAQSASGASDIDRGQAIKDISARQTQALLEATGINVEGMRSQLQKAAVEVVMKLMHLVGLYNHLAGRDKYQFGHRFTSMDRTRRDFTTSMLYDVQIMDSKTAVTNEERLLWNGLLKTVLVDAGGVLRPYFNMEQMAEATARKYGEGPEMLASANPPRPPVSALPEMPGDPMAMGNPMVPGGASAKDAAYGQHPEREAGSRGLDLGNVLQGQFRVGG